MVAALVRLLHSGVQDTSRLLPKDGPKDCSAFLRVWIRGGRLTTQWSRLDFQQKPNFGTTAFCQLVKKGELLTRLYLVCNLPDIYTPQAAAIASAGASFRGPRFGWTNSLGHALIASATVDIGGVRVETIESRLLEIHDEYDVPIEKLVNKNTMIGRIDNGFGETSLGNSAVPQRVIVPLPFWFSKGDLGAALPIDAIHVDEIRVGITFRPATGVYYTDSRAPATAVVPTVEGSALWPILGSKFYKADPISGTVVPGLALNKQENASLVSPIAGITMPLTLALGDTYLLAEYMYLDRPEANMFRQAEIEIPVVQHYRIEPRDTRGFTDVTIPLELPQPTRHLYFMAQNYFAIPYNAYFLATRDLSGSSLGYYSGGLPIAAPASETYAPWWPDCSGLNAAYVLPLVPGFSTRGSEPFATLELFYEGTYVKTSTAYPALYRSILPSLEERKSPFINRYMYCIPLGIQAGYFPPSVPTGQTNMNRIMKKSLRFGIAGGQGVQEISQVVAEDIKTARQRLWIYCYAETHNILRIYGGRAAMLFAY